MKYRKKAITIEATQWFKNGDHPEDYKNSRDGIENGVIKKFSGEYAKEKNWEGEVVQRFRHPTISGDTVCKHCRHTLHNHGWIDTLEGGHVVCPKDYIITGINGEYYPCRPDIFIKTYEKIKE